MRVAVFYGSVREGRQGIKAAKWIVKKLEERGHDATLLDPKELKIPLLEKMHKSYEEGEAPKQLEVMKKILEDAEGYVLVSGEYNHSIPPALTNLVDHFLEEYFFKPSALVTYSAGGFGGVRAAMQLRALTGETGMVSIPSIFAISKVQDSFDEEGNALDESYEKRIGKFLDEFEWYMQALKSQREKGVPYG